MKVRSGLDDVFASTSHVRVLRLLVARMQPLSGRQVARETELHPKSVFAVLGKLELLGLVNRVRGGRDHLFSINRNHWLTKQVLLPLFLGERKFQKALESHLIDTTKGLVESLMLFGSVARGEEILESDLDVCVITKTANQRRHVENRLHDLAKVLSEEFGVRVAWLFLSVATLRNRARAEDPLVLHLMSEGKVLSGKPLRELIHHGKV